MSRAQREHDHQLKVHAACYESIQELRDTLRSNYNPKELGYDSVQHARETIIKLVDRKINRLCAELLTAQGEA